MECLQCKFCSKAVSLQTSRPDYLREGRICDSCRWRAFPKCGMPSCKTPQRKQGNLKSLPSIFFSLGEEGKKEVLKLLNKEHANAANVLCCTSCYMKVRQMVRNIVQARPPQATPSQATPSQSTPPQATLPQGTTLQTTPPQVTGHISTSALDDAKPVIGRPRVSYNLASTRTKSEIKKKARQICNANKTNFMQQLNEISHCSKEVLEDISTSKMSSAKVGCFHPTSWVLSLNGFYPEGIMLR